MSILPVLTNWLVATQFHKGEFYMPHPLSDIELRIADFKGFGDLSGFERFMPINVLIGRNNTGKSALIDALELCISRGEYFNPLKHARNGKPFRLHLTQTMDEASLRKIFLENTSGGAIPGNHWEFARPFMGRRITREFSAGWQPTLVGPEFVEMQNRAANAVNNLMSRMSWPFDGMQIVRISAERDIVPEPSTTDRKVQPNGQGATNLIRAFLLSDDLPRAAVEYELLSDMNQVYLGDSVFTSILVKEDSNSARWEIFLREEKKGDIRLSQSGSSLKSVFILLAMIRLMPLIQKTDWEKIVFALEEPENNLHPSLLRRLLKFLAEQRDRLNFTLIITTHSPVCIDWSARRGDSQILHVKSIDETSFVSTAVGYTNNTEILDDLDVRASDILQANGIIWVEGPSDRVYLKKWIEIVSSGEIIEGVHYATMFYGGKVLSHFDALPPNESLELISLLSLNRNAALLMDSDRHLGDGKTKTGRPRRPRMHINATKKRIKDQLEKMGAFVWITEGREIENYLCGNLIGRLVASDGVNVGPYDDVPSLIYLKKFKGNKIALAHAATDVTCKDDLLNNMDLYEKLIGLIQEIESWNAIATRPRIAQ